MKKIIMGLLITVTAVTAIGCGDSKEKAHIRELNIGRKEVDNNRRHNELMHDQGMLTKAYRGTKGVANTLGTFQTLENAVKTIPGIVDAKIISYKDNVIVGVAKANDSYQEKKRRDQKAEDKQHRDEITTENRTRVNTDTYDERIVKAVRLTLQGQGKGRLLYITSDHFNYEKIAELKYREQMRQPIHDDEYRTLIGDIGFIMEPYNLLD